MTLTMVPSVMMSMLVMSTTTMACDLRYHQEDACDHGPPDDDEAGFQLGKRC